MSDVDPRERFLRARKLFDEVCELPADERTARLRELTEGDTALLREVEELLAADEVADEALGTSAGSALGFDRAALLNTIEIPGVVLGEPIGSGGMGVVYEARQERPERQVAVKLLHPGWVNQISLRRFEDEARVLGWLSHPGIATVYEAGQVETPHGSQPYLVMELVRGERLDHYVERKGLDVAGRLRLLSDVCRAVQHAHQKGVVHRDLKPANILVTAEGQTKVLDFGVARIIDPDFESTRQTGAGEMLGTLPYMSPEQVRADPSEIDTRVDVYALGVLGYELLTGSRPLDVSSRPLHEAARIILEEDPTSMGDLRPSLRGDVATIVHKAMAKEKDRRYASAEELAQDIGRFLTDEPIRAVPPTRSYLLRKFARRNRIVLTAASVVLVGLVTGLVIALLGLQRALDERDQKNNALATVSEERDAKEDALRLAERERDDKDHALQESEDVTQFLAETLYHVVPELSGKDVKLRTVLDGAAERIDEEFAEEPRVAARLYLMVGRAYLSLGEIAQAIDYLERCYALSESARDVIDPAMRVQYALGYGSALRDVGRVADAVRVLTPVLEELRAEESPDLHVLSRTLHQLASSYKDLGNLEAAAPLAEEAYETMVDAYGPDAEETLVTASGLAITLSGLGDLESAQPIFEDLLERYESLYGVGHPETFKTRYNLATVYTMRGYVERALELDEGTLRYRREALGEEHPSTAIAMSGVAMGYMKVGRAQEAIDLLEPAIVILTRDFGPTHKQTMVARSALAQTLSVLERYGEALELWVGIVEDYETHIGIGFPDSMRARMQMATVLGQLEDYASGIEIMRENVEILRARHPDDHRDVIANRGELGKLLREDGQYEEAVEVLSEAFAQETASSAYEAAIARGELAILYLQAGGEFDKPQRALELARAAQIEATRDRRSFAEILARAAFAAGEFEEALTVHERLPQLMPPMSAIEREAYDQTLVRYRAALPTAE